MLVSEAIESNYPELHHDRPSCNLAGALLGRVEDHCHQPELISYPKLRRLETSPSDTTSLA